MNRQSSPSPTHPAAAHCAVRRPRFGFGIATSALLIVGLTACATPIPTRWHSLMPPQWAVASAPAGLASPSPGALAMSVTFNELRIPGSVDSPQWVVQRPDGSLLRLEQERWASPLSDELRAALMHRLTTQWRIGDARWQNAAEARQSWRLHVDVTRFEMQPGEAARLEGAWSLHAPRGATLTCRSAIQQLPASGGMPELAQAQRVAVQQLADDIGRTLGALASANGTTPVGCPSHATAR